MNATKTLFLAFVGGALLIVLLRTLVPGLLGVTLAVSAAVFIIVGVGLLYHSKLDDAEDRQVAGDNLYYLGLLFTLLSLILTLLQLFVFESQADVNDRANELIGNFGVALISTVAGILARILFQSHQSDPQNPEVEGVRAPDVRSPPNEINRNILAIDTDARELREEMSRLRLVLREASDAFLHFSRISSEQSESVIDHTGTMMQRQSEDLNKAAIHQLEQVSVSLKSVANTFQSEMSTLSSHCTHVIEEFMNRMSAETNRGIVDTSRAWNEAAVEMREGGKRQIEAIYGDINALLQSSERTHSKMADLSESVGDSVSGIRNHAESLRTMVKDSANAGGEMKRFLESMSNARSELESMAGIASNSAREIEQGNRELADIQSKLVTELNDTHLKAVREYAEASAQITGQATRQVEANGENLRDAIATMTNELDDHQRIGAEQLSNARQLSEQLSEEATQWRTLAEHTRQSLVEATEHLVDVVKKN